MSILGNIIWFIFGGFFGGIAWIFFGLLWSITIVGLPVGIQCFKLARMSFFPFGKEIVDDGKASSLLLNILWIIFGGIEIAAVHLVSGLVLMITIVGMPFAMQNFKLARLALLPFGAKIVVK